MIRLHFMEEFGAIEDDVKDLVRLYVEHLQDFSSDKEPLIFNVVPDMAIRIIEEDPFIHSIDPGETWDEENDNVGFAVCIFDEEEGEPTSLYIGGKYDNAYAHELSRDEWLNEVLPDAIVSQIVMLEFENSDVEYDEDHLQTTVDDIISQLEKIRKGA